jgi:hypothetical protein
MSCESKLRAAAAANSALVAALTWPNAQGNSTFFWFDRQLVQGALGAIVDGRAAVTVQRISTKRDQANQGSLNTPMSSVWLQINCVSYNAEQARTVAQLVTNFMNGLTLLGAANQAPNKLLNERAGMLFEIQPPAYVETQDWRVFNNENL